MLDSGGIDLREAPDAEEGLDGCGRGGAFDLMLVDWNMPGMSGPEMIAQARQEGMVDLKILMVTTEAENECIVKALEAGADEFLMKPFDEEALMEKLALMGLEQLAE